MIHIRGPCVTVYVLNMSSSLNKDIIIIIIIINPKNYTPKFTQTVVDYTL